MKTITVENIGPVSHASIPINETGGVTVIRARNGQGKTRILEAIESTLNGRGKTQVRDGALAGSVDGFGVTLRVGRSTRRTGELEVITLEGKLSVADLVDPGIKSPEAADAKRIKSLIQLTNVEPSVELFHDMLGGRDIFDAVVSTAATEAADLVVMADRIKRDCEAAARKKESEADHAEGRARGAREAAGAVDDDAESDAEVLQQRLEKAIRRESELKAMENSAIEAESATARARRQLSEAEAEYDGPTIEEAAQTEQLCSKEVDDAKTAVRKAEEALASARNWQKAAEADHRHATGNREAAERHQSTVAKWREQIEAGIPVAPSREEIEAATAAVRQARQAVELGVMVRNAKSKLDEAKAHAEASLSHRKQAAKLREAAKGTDEVLSSVVSQTGSDLRVEAGRLVLDTRRGDTYFGELSHGERWRIALDVAIQAVNAIGPNGVIPLPQEAWEGLDPIARQAIVDQVKGSGVVILTAECSADETINAEVMA